MKIRLDKELKCKSQNHQCGNACIPKNKECQLDDEHIETIIKKYEDRIKDLPKEQAIAIDKSGKVVVYKGGDETSVYFTPEEVRSLKGTVVTHNHPNIGNWKKPDERVKGFSFSEDDWNAAHTIEVKEIRAVSSGYRHSLKPAPEGWNRWTWALKGKPVYDRHRREVLNEMQMDVYSGKLRHDIAEVEYWHEVNKRTAKDLKVIYKREEIKKK